MSSVGLKFDFYPVFLHWKCRSKLMDDKSRMSIGLTVLVLFALSGCVESPEKKAAKETRNANARALAVLRAGGDSSAVRKELQKAPLGDKKDLSSRDTALFIGANLSFDRAEQAHTELIKIRMDIPAFLEKISITSAEIRESELEADRLRILLAAGDRWVNQLRDMLGGSNEQGPGLRAELDDLQMQANELFRKKELLQSQLGEAQRQAAELRQKSDNLLHMAEQASEEERMWLRQRAFELLKGRGDANVPGRTALLTKAQKMLDEISDLDSRLAFIIPRIDKLTEDVATGEDRLKDIENSSSRSQMRVRLSDIQAQLTDRRYQIKKTIEQLAALEENYGRKLNEVVEFYGDASDEYEKINSSMDTLIKVIASMAAADSFFRIGRVYDEYMELQSRLADRLNLLAEVAEANVARELGDAAREYTGNTQRYGDKAAENYDRAINVYEKLHRSTGRKKDDFSHSVTANCILVLYAKARVAEQLGKEDWRIQAVEQAEELAGKAAESDPDFERSITRSLLQSLK
jgi:chromosome segregation ATPase